MRLLLMVLALALGGVAQAQTYPSKTVRLISGVTPGSASDTMARMLAERLSASLGQPVIVENRLGAGGLVGAKWVATQEPDGHYIMMYASGEVQDPAGFRRGRQGAARQAQLRDRAIGQRDPHGARALARGRRI